MADKDFAVKNGISIAGGAVSINSSAFYVSGSFLLNTTTYIGTANNSTFAYGKTEGNLSVLNSAQLGGTAASGYQTTAGLSANVATLTANNATNLGGVAASSYLQTSSTPTISGNWTFSGTTVFSGTANFTGTYNLSKANAATSTLTDGATITPDCTNGPIWFVTLGGNRAIAVPNNPKIGTYLFYVKQDATGSRTLTWNAIFKWPAGVAPTLTTTANAVDLISLTYDGANWYGSYIPDLR